LASLRRGEQQLFRKLDIHADNPGVHKSYPVEDYFKSHRAGGPIIRGIRRIWHLQTCFCLGSLRDS
jgi:hypothetical protein